MVSNRNARTDQRPRLALIRDGRRLAIVCLAVGLTTALLLPVRAHLSPILVALIYLTLVWLIALKSDRWAARLGAAVAFLSFDFFFVPPYGSFSTSRVDALALSGFLVVAVGFVEVIDLLQHRAREAEAREQVANSISRYAALLLAEIGPGLPVDVLTDTAHLLDATDCTVIDPEAAPAAEPWPAYVDGTVLSHVATTHEPSITDGPTARSLYLPLLISERLLGVLVATGPLSGWPAGQKAPSPEMLAVGRTLAIALDRARLIEEASQLEALQRSEQFKSILLTALSHDLKTPIATVKARVSGLLQTDAHWDEDGQRAGLMAIDEATDRLNRQVSNLLDLSNIEAGLVVPNLDSCDLEDIVGSAAANVRPLLAGRQLDIRLPEDLPLVRADHVLLVQALSNVLDNAVRYTAASGHILVEAQAGDEAITLSVCDDGPGIAQGEREKVFERFYRIADERSQVPGVGLGLAISRALVEKTGGRVWINDSPLGGTGVWFSLPVQP